MPSSSLRELEDQKMDEFKQQLEKCIRDRSKKFIGQPATKKNRKRMAKLLLPKIIEMMNYFEPLVEHEVSIDESDLKDGYFTVNIKRKLKNSLILDTPQLL